MRGVQPFRQIHFRQVPGGSRALGRGHDLDHKTQIDLVDFAPCIGGLSLPLRLVEKFPLEKMREPVTQFPPLLFIGFCPAMHDGLPCPSLEKCNGEKTYGLVVRVKCEEDLRRFPPIGRATKQFERLYNGRTAVERVNGRLKIFWGVDDGNVIGARRFHAHVGVVMVVHLALARWLAKQPRWEGCLSAVSVSPIAQALARLDDECAPVSLPEQEVAAVGA